MIQQNPLIKEYLDITFRRKWWIVLPALVGLLFSIALFFRFDKLYRAETRVAIRDQTISRDLMRPVIDFQHEELVTRISGEVTSEVYVAQLDEKLMLVSEAHGPSDLTELAKALNRAIKVDTNPRDRYFTLKVVWDDRRLAAAIANELAAIYIERNQDIRKNMAGEAVDKLREKRETYEQRLTEIRERISRFRADHKFEIESFQRTNEQLIDSNNTDIQRINDRVRTLQASISTAIFDRGQTASTGGTGVDQRAVQLQEKRSELLTLTSSGYADAHPDVLRLKNEIASLEQALKAGGETPEENLVEGSAGGRYDLEIAQYRDTIAALEAERADLVAKNLSVEARLKATPDRQNELNRMEQQEENLVILFEEAFSRETKAIEGQTLEEFQAGERFDVLNSAFPPAKPFWPDLRLFLIMGLSVGAGLGILVVLLLEVFDQSFKSEEQLAASIDYPILAVIPDLGRAAERSKRRGKTRVRKKKAS